MKTAQTRKDTIQKVYAKYPQYVGYSRIIDVLCLIEDGFLTHLTPLDIESLRFAPSPESYPRSKREAVTDNELTLPKEVAKRNKKLADDTRAYYVNKKVPTPIVERIKQYRFEGNVAIPV